MENSQYPLTKFLLDLTDVEGLYEDFIENRSEYISKHRLQRYEKLLMADPFDVPALREAVRAEVTGGERAPSDLDKKDVIRGIRPPPPPNGPP